MKAKINIYILFFLLPVLLPGCINMRKARAESVDTSRSITGFGDAAFPEGRDAEKGTFIELTNGEVVKADSLWREKDNIHMLTSGTEQIYKTSNIERLQNDSAYYKKYRGNFVARMHKGAISSYKYIFIQTLTDSYTKMVKSYVAIFEMLQKNDQGKFYDFAGPDIYELVSDDADLKEQARPYRTNKWTKKALDEKFRRLREIVNEYNAKHP